MEYHFTIVHGKIHCNGKTLHYIYRPTHEYVNYVKENGSTRTHYVNYDDKKESFYAYGPWNNTRVPDNVVKNAIKGFKAGYKTVKITP